MLERIFDTNNVVFRFFRTLGYIWWLHILWFICSPPVITIGAATTALCYSCMKLHKKEGYVTRNFFHSFKENFMQSTLLFLILTLICGILLTDLFLCGYMDKPLSHLIRYGAYALLAVYALTVIYVFAVQAKFVNPIRKTLAFSFVIASRYWKYTIQMLIIVALVIALNMTIVLFNFITLSIGIGIVAYIMAAYHNKVFDHILQ